MENLTITAPDISCEHCQRTIEREVGGMLGVQSVSVDVPDKRVTVGFDRNLLSRDEIVAKLDDLGYPVARPHGEEAV